LNLGGGTGDWSSDNSAIATVNTSGVVTGVAAGTTYIVYSITGCGGTPSAKQLVTIDPDASIGSVTGTSPLCISGTATYTANTVVLSTHGTGSWSSSNTAVATVSTSGLVTGVSNGTSNIIYTISGGCNGTPSAQKNVTINLDASIVSVTGSSPICIGSGNAVSYTANTVVLGGGTGSWSSSATGVATVSTSGLVTGVAAGTSDITYTITGGCNGTPSAYQQITIHPNASISSVTGTSPLCIGATATYNANTVYLGGGSGAWSSDNTAIATVNASSGVVTGVSVGSCNIKYTITGGCGGTQSAQQVVNISPDASIGSVTGTTPLCINANATYHANTVVLSGGSGSWSSDNTDIATVDASSGVVTAVSDGSCDIIYSISGGCNTSPTAQQVLNVNPDAYIQGVTGTTPLCIGATATYTTYNIVMGGGTGGWSSTATGIATVDASTGVVTAVSAGTCYIVYTINGCNGTPTAKQKVTINSDASIASVTGTSPLCLTGTATYHANTVDLGGGSGAWSSSSTAIATVSTSGLVTGVSAGTGNITYTITGGCGGTQSAYQSVTVNEDASIASVSGTSTLCISGTATYSSNTVVLGGGSGAWSSSNTAIATVSTSGIVTGVSDGTCNITYTITGGCNGTQSAHQQVTISTNASIASVTGTSPLCISGTATYSANTVDLGGAGSAAWSSSNTSIATVSTSGIVTGVSDGTCNITYTITGGCNGTQSAHQQVTINTNASIASVTGTSPMCIGATATYNANTVDLGSTGSGAWSSSNTAIATVDASSGEVTCVAAGTCNIAYTITGGCGGTQSAQQLLTVYSNSWIGTTSTNWNTAANWCNGVPTSTTDVVIPSGTTYSPHVTSDPTTPAVCNNLTINSGAVLTVDAGKALTVNGTTTLASAQCLILKSAAGQAAGGTGSFIDNGITGSGTAKVEKYLSTGRYWYIGSPITSTSAVNAYGTMSTVPSTGTRDFYWNEPTHAYVTTVNSDILIPSRGYAFEEFGSSPITATYIGNLNTGTVTANLTYTAGTKQGFNLVSNPYPSAINWGSQNSPTTGLTQTNIEQTIQYKVPGTYATWNSMGSGTGVNGGQQYVPAMQAFWVRVAAGNSTGNIQFTNAIRVHSSQAAYKLTDPPNLFRLEISRDTLIDESVVTFYAAALGGFENYDSPKMLSDEPSYPQLYSYTTNSVQVAVNGQPLLVSGVERVIPLGYLTNVAGNLKITATNLAQFDPNTTVYLEDVLLNTTQNLSSNKTYSFTSNAGTFNSRFKLHFNKSSNSLPIQLVSFDAKCQDNKVNVNWSTASETNNDYFTIERSADASSWEFLKKVAGSGNSNALLNYSTMDNNPLSGISYYRLKQTDFNGQSETFSPVAVKCSEESSQLDITYYPNPFTSEVYAVINNSISDNAIVNVYNILGSIVYSKNINHDQLALKSFELDLSKLTDGVYFIEFKSDSYSGITKLVKTNKY